MGSRLFYFVFKNVLFFIYSVEQNTKEIISLRKYEEAFSTGMAVTCLYSHCAQGITDSP